MKKFLTVLLTAVLLLFINIPVYAHNWPSNPGDWTAKDWEAWNNYWWQQYYQNQKQNCGPTSNEYSDFRSSGRYNYYNDQVPNNGCNNPGNGYNNSYNYQCYNYYSGVLDVYQPETEDQAVILAKIIYLYGHGVASQTQQAAIGWSVLNSVDDSGSGNNIGTIAPNFHYDATKPTKDDFGRDLMPLARDIIFRWKAGRAGICNNGRVLPNGYDYISSTGSVVAFKTRPDASGCIWGFTLATPYPN